MSIISNYLITTKNLEKFFNSIITAKAPEIFTTNFLTSLEFKSTNDRLYIPLLKGLGFLDQGGVPTERYFQFLDQSQSKKILAEAIRESYEDLFNVHTEANKLEQQEIKSKIRTLTQGKNSDKVDGLIANTFKALVDYADWNKSSEKNKKSSELKEPSKKINLTETEDEDEDQETSNKKIQKAQLHYNIQIHLPESRDSAVYDAIFKSLKKHLF